MISSLQNLYTMTYPGQVNNKKHLGIKQFFTNPFQHLDNSQLMKRAISITTGIEGMARMIPG